MWYQNISIFEKEKKISGKVLTDKKTRQTPQSRKVSVSGAVHSRDKMNSNSKLFQYIQNFVSILYEFLENSN